jgi:YfiH family protein
MYIKSKTLSLIPGIAHGFGTLDEPIPSLVSTDIWEHTKPRWQQVHGDSVARVHEPSQNCGDVDGLYTWEQQVPIAVVTADCVPILLSHRSGKAVAAVHAGWRGTRSRILSKLWKQLANQGEKPQNWVAAIGPSIGPCCYEVSEDLARDFVQEFKSFGESVVSPRYRILDLPAINAAQLHEIGLSQVDLVRACTQCSKSPTFHSFRREGKGTRQWSMVMRLEGSIDS